MAATTIEWTWQRVFIGPMTEAEIELACENGAWAEGGVLHVPGFTFNPWIGCTKVDELCAHCYADAQDKFRHWTPEGWGPGKPRRRTSEANWKKVRAWNELAGRLAIRLRVFCASLADWLDDDGISPDLFADLLSLIRECKNLDWLLLTKRPENFGPRMQAALNIPERGCPLAFEWYVKGEAPANVWMGTSVGHQKSADKRIPELLKIPARVRFLSCEPMLGPVNLERVEFGPAGSLNHTRQSVLTPTYMGRPHSHDAKIDWVICGGESGGGARPMHPDWARSLRDQCAAAGVPFLYKQWGEWAPGIIEGSAVTFTHSKETKCPKNPEWFVFRNADRSETHMLRAGKKAAGRLLDGAEHNGSPEVKVA